MKGHAAVRGTGGLRPIAADLVGLGRSDKPSEIGDHSFARHVEWIRALAFDHLDLRGLTLVGQDWGGLIGLRLVAEHPGRFARVVAANTGRPTGDQPMPDVWLRFREVVRTSPSLSVSRLVQSGGQITLPPRSWPPTRRPFPIRTMPPRSGPCRDWSRHLPTTRPRWPTGPPGVSWPPGTSHSWWRSATATDHRCDGVRPEEDRARGGGP